MNCPRISIVFLQYSRNKISNNYSAYQVCFVRISDTD